MSIENKVILAALIIALSIIASCTHNSNNKILSYNECVKSNLQIADKLKQADRFLTFPDCDIR
jgi:hypothetical protein